jgi:hypothetical protein
MHLQWRSMINFQPEMIYLLSLALCDDVLVDSVIQRLLDYLGERL